jgi:hypothetical protein
MTSVDIDHLLQLDEVRQLLDGAEHAGSLRAAELADLVELHELDALEQDALVHELEQRGIEVIDGQPPEPAPDPVPAVTVAVSPTRSSSSSARRAATNCSRPPRRSRSPSGSSAATWRRSSR